MEPNPGNVSSPVIESAKPGAGYYFARIGAAIIDLIVLFLIFYVAGMAVAVRVGGVTGPGNFNVTGLPALAVMGITAVLGFSYYWFFEALFGRTLGKMIFQLKVVRERGASCGILSSLIRNLLRVVDGFFGYLVGLICILATQRQQRVGDLAAKTFVVKASSRPLQVVGILSFIVLMALGVWGSRKIQSVTVASTPSSPAAPSAGGMSLHDLRFTEGKEGPPTAKAYSPGEDLYLRFEVRGVSVNPEGRADAALQFTAMDSQGRLLLDPIRVEAKGPSPVKPAVVPSNFHLTLPSYVEGGPYTIQIVVRDHVSGGEMSQKIPFQVKGPQIASGLKLGFENFQFLESKGGPVLPDAAYSPGTTVYSRFLAVGFGLGEKNQVKLRLDLTVLSSSGEKLLEQKDLLKVAEDFYYPPRYLVMNTSVNTPSQVTPGKYVIHYVLTDEISGVQAELDQSFTVR